jgi:Uma2 family endonuclease
MSGDVGMVLLEKLYTADEFFEIAGLPENREKRLELDDGEIVEMAESSPVNTVTAARIVTFINIFVMSHDSGYVTGADGGFKLGDKRVRQPDVGFISKQRAPRLPKRFGLAPDLAVELVSPDEDIFRKAREYLHAGTRLVWAVYTDEKTVYVMTLDPDGSVRSKPFGIDTTLDGGDVLPGFTLPVKDIFPG